MPRHRSHSTEFKRQVVAAYHAGETLHALARSHDLSRNLIRIWVEKAEAGGLDDDDAAAAELLGFYEARIAAFERLVGCQALEIEFQKGALKHAAAPRSGTTWSRRVVGYAISRTIDARLAVAALERAIALRRPLPGCVFHSDRGSQYASERHRTLLAAHGLIGSMSRRGNPYDNAQAESFMKTLKVEAV